MADFYTVKGGDTIYDVCYNTSGGLFLEDGNSEIVTTVARTIIEDNDTETPMLPLKELQSGFNPKAGQYVSTDNAFQYSGPRSIEVLVMTTNDITTAQYIFRQLDQDTQNFISLTVVDNALQFNIFGAIVRRAVMPNTMYNVVIANRDIYINNVHQGTIAPVTPDYSGELYVGAANNVANNFPFMGIINHLRIFDIELTAEQVSDIWNNGKPGEYRLMDKSDLAGEYLAVNLNQYTWLDSSGNRRNLTVQNRPEIKYRINLPLENYMETYTPDIPLNTILDVRNVRTVNLEAVRLRNFNSTYDDKQAVDDEIEFIRDLIESQMMPTATAQPISMSLNNLLRLSHCQNSCITELKY